MLEAHLTRFNTMADGGGRLQFDTQELTPDQFSEVGKVNKQVGLLVFYPGRTNVLSPEEKDKVIEGASSGLGTNKKSTKSKSQQLRLQLLGWFEDDNQGFEEFEDFYEHFMDKFIAHVKVKRS